MRIILRRGSTGELGKFIGKILRGGETQFFGDLGNALLVFPKHFLCGLDFGVGDGFTDANAGGFLVKRRQSGSAVMEILGNTLYT